MFAALQAVSASGEQAPQKCVKHFAADPEELPFAFADYPKPKQYGFSVRVDRMSEKVEIFSMGVFISESELKSSNDIAGARRFGIQGQVTVDKRTPAQMLYGKMIEEDEYAYAYCTLRNGHDFDQYIIRIRSQKSS